MVGFGKRLRELRGSAKQTDAAQELGINYSTYAMYEVDRREPNFDTLVSVAKHYGVTTDYLLGLSDCKTMDADEQAIRKKTGLSGRAIQRLIGLNNHYAVALTTDALEDRVFSNLVYEALLLYLSYVIEQPCLDTLIKTIVEIAFSKSTLCEAQVFYENTLIELNKIGNTNLTEVMISPYLRQKALAERIREENELTTNYIIDRIAESDTFKQIVHEAQKNAQGMGLHELQNLMRGHSKEFPIDPWN